MLFLQLSSQTDHFSVIWEKPISFLQLRPSYDHFILPYYCIVSALLQHNACLINKLGRKFTIDQKYLVAVLPKFTDVVCNFYQFLKTTFSEIMWFDHFIFQQILTIFQHFHHFWGKSSLQVGIYLIIHTCKLIFNQCWWQCWNVVKIWWKVKFSNHMISKNVFFKLNLISP